MTSNRIAAAAVAPTSERKMSTSSSTAVIPAPKRGDRGSMPRGAVAGGSGWEMGAPGDAGKGAGDDVRADGAADPRTDGAVAVEHEGRGGLQDVEAVGQLGPPGKVDLHMAHASEVVGDGAEHPCGGRTGCAELGGELEQGGASAERGGSDGVRLEH